MSDSKVSEGQAGASPVETSPEPTSPEPTSPAQAVPVPAADVRALRLQAEAALAAGDPAGAEELLRQALVAGPDDLFALVIHARAALARGDGAEALARLDTAEARHPRHSWPLLERGNTLQKLGRSDEAIAAWTAGLGLSPQDFHCHLALARSHRGRGQTDLASRHFAAAVAAQPDNAVAWAEYARLARAAEGTQAGLDILARAVAACGETPAIARLRIELLTAAGQWDEAIPLLEAGLRDAPGDAALRQDLARARAGRGETAAAEALFGEVALDPAVPAALRVDACLAAGRLCRARGDSLAALAFFQRAALLDAAHVMPLCESGRVWIACRELDLANALFEKAVALDDRSLSAWLGLSDVLCARGLHREGLAAILRAAALDATNSYVAYRTGIIQRDLGHAEAAAAALARIGPDQPHRDLAQSALGHMARAQQRHEAARDHFEAAAQAATNPEGPWLDLAALCLETGDLDGGRAWIARVMERNPASCRGQMARGRLLRAGQDRKAALAAFEAAHALAPAEATPLVEIATERDALGDDAGARQAIDSALAIDPLSHEGLLRQAEFLSRAGAIEAALEVYARLRKAEPTAVWAYLGAAHLLGQHGAPAAALALLDEAARLCPAKAAIAVRKVEIQRQRGLIDEACTILDGARATFGDDTWLWLSDLQLATQYGDSARADRLLAEAKVIPGRQASRLSAARARRHEMDWQLDEAMTWYRRAAGEDPADGQHQMDIARLAMLRGDIAGMKAALTAHAALRKAVAGAGASINISQSLLGQIHDEVRLEPEVVRRLPVLREASGDEAVTAMAATLRDFPDSTVAAIGLAVALRQAGAFRRGQDPAGTSGFPLVISQYWNEPEPPEDIAELMATWAAHNPDHRIQIFHEETAADYLCDAYGAEALRAFRRAPHQAQKADILRLGLLAREGGFYVDADDRCRVPVASLVPAGVDLLVYQEDHGSFGNNVIGARPGHPAIAAAFEQALAAVTRADLDIIWLSTGPGLLTRALCGWLAKTPETMAERLATTAVLTVQEMRRLAAMHCHAVYKTTGNAWLTATFRKA